LNFGSSARDVFLLHKNSNFSAKGKIDIVLSPELYWCKNFSIPVVKEHEIKLLLPTYFDDYIEDTSLCNYYFIPLSEPKMYLCFAYKQDDIIQALTQSGLNLSQINKMYFAQNEFKEFEVLKDTSKDTDSTIPPIVIQPVEPELKQVVPELAKTDNTDDEKDFIDNFIKKSSKDKTAHKIASRQLSQEAYTAQKESNDDYDLDEDFIEDDSKPIPEQEATTSLESEQEQEPSPIVKFSTLPGLGNIFRVSSKFFSYQGSYLVQIPKVVSIGLEVNDVDIRTISLSNHTINMTYDSKYISLSSIFILSVILFLSASINYFKTYEFFILNSDIPKQMQKLKKLSKTPKTFLETNSIIKKYNTKAKQYYKIRNALDRVINFKKSFNGSLKSISLKNGAMVIVFDNGRVSAIKNYFSQYYKISISRDEKNIITLRFKIK
jgi:hypothetical protein